MMRSVIALAGFLFVTLATGFLGSAATARSVREWYPYLAKPPLTPPDAVFAPVWTVLFVIMAIAAWLVWRASSPVSPRRALTAFWIQLGLNLAWSVLFFGLRRPGAALIEIAILWCAILATLLLFSHQTRVAGWLLLPYLAWVSFAVYLNLGIWWLNA